MPKYKFRFTGEYEVEARDPSVAVDVAQRFVRKLIVGSSLGGAGRNGSYRVDNGDLIFINIERELKEETPDV